MKAEIALCGPPGFCTYDTKKKACIGITSSPTVPVVGRELSDPERTTTCGYAGKDADCPDGGCIGVQVTLPDKFTAGNQVVQQDLPSKRSLFPEYSALEQAACRGQSHACGNMCRRQRAHE